MPCYHPLQAYQCASGEVVFVELQRHDIVRSLSLPCGQCIGCRLERSRQWAVRCMHEASLHELNCFVTLTYDDDHYPVRGDLRYPDYQAFMKRLRKFADPMRVRFYMCGEYGPENWRPHFHACLFGFDFLDKTYWSRSPAGERLYRSADLERLWPFGFSSVGAVSFESAAYIARYCVQKITGRDADAYYAREDDNGPFQLTPPFNHMSLKPGIGAPWLDRFQTDVYPRDYVVVNGVECRAPKYYDKLFGRADADTFEALKEARILEGRARFEDNTDARLAVKEVVQRARITSLERKML